MSKKSAVLFSYSSSKNPYANQALQKDIIDYSLERELTIVKVIHVVDEYDFASWQELIMVVINSPEPPILIIDNIVFAKCNRHALIWCVLGVLKLIKPIEIYYPSLLSNELYALERDGSNLLSSAALCFKQINEALADKCKSSHSSKKLTLKRT